MLKHNVLVNIFIFFFPFTYYISPRKIYTVVFSPSENISHHVVHIGPTLEEFPKVMGLKVGDEGRGRREGTGEWVLTFLFSFFFFLFFTHIISANHSHCTRLFLCSILRPFCEQWKIKTRTHRHEERNAVTRRESLRRFVKDRSRSPCHFDYVVSIFDATNWKFSAGQSSIIQNYWTATDAFHLLFSVPLVLPNCTLL